MVTRLKEFTKVHAYQHLERDQILLCGAKKSNKAVIAMVHSDDGEVEWHYSIFFKHVEKCSGIVSDGDSIEALIQ